jgi:tetratricopeptide (TPR) repeat protein
MPAADVLGSELEALRIDVMLGRAQEALPEIEERLAQVRRWWQQRRAGESVPQAPDTEFLGRLLVGGLNIAGQASLSLERWGACLELVGETEQAERELGEGQLELAITRFNRYGPLIRLGRLDEAQRVVEECLAVFRGMDDLTHQSGALSAMADIWAERGDTGQAIALARQALAIRNRLPDPCDRAISHGNLSTYLHKAAQTAECARHDLATGVYFLVSDYEEHLLKWSRNLGVKTRLAADAGGRYDLPPLSDLLARPEFNALSEFLKQSQVDPQQLQAKIDELVAQARREAEA